MNKDEYKKLVDRLTPRENKFKNFLISFFVGGLLGMSGEIIVHLLINSFSIEKDVAYMILCMLVILFGSLSTAMGFFDNWVSKCKCGLIIPTTGFAHSITSSALDYKKDGLISGLGSNFFKLAGSVILYGILSSVILLMIRMILWLV